MRKIICPACRNLMNRGIRNWVAIDVCSKCGGIWFDQDILKSYIYSYLKDNPDVPAQALDIDKKIIGINDIKEQVLICPICNIPMEKYNYMYDSNIILDRCAKCNGVWTEKDEIKALVSYVKGNPAMRELANAMLEDKKPSDEFVVTTQHKARSSNWSLLRFLFVPMLIPLGDYRISFKKSSATILFITINIVVFFACWSSKDIANYVFSVYGMYPQKILSGQGLYTLITSNYLHFSLGHLLSNMYFLYFFGRKIEDRLGSGLFLIGYLFFGLCGNLLSLVDPSIREACHAGASGAIAGVMGAYFIYFPKNKIMTHFLGYSFYMSAYFYLGVWIVYQMVFVFRGSGSGIGWFAHIGGFFAGIIMANIFDSKKSNLKDTQKIKDNNSVKNNL